MRETRAYAPCPAKIEKTSLRSPKAEFDEALSSPLFFIAKPLPAQSAG